MFISKELIQQCIDNDRKAQLELYKACYSFIMRICYRYHTSKDDVLAAHNESFLKIVLNLKSYKADAPFEVWARRITINTIIDGFRKNKKLKETIEYIDTTSPDYVEEPLDDSNEVEMKLEAEDLYKLIYQLPPMCQKVFNLYVIDGYNHREIGELLGVTEGTSKSQLFDARKKLQQMLKNYHTPKAASNESAK